MSGQFKSFVSEEEVKEQRKQKQQEWERVRKEDDPIECPEEAPRSLFEQLEANRDIKERELEEETKLRSSVKGLDADEVQFLDFVANRQMQIEKDRNLEEKAVLEELKSASVLKVQDKTQEKSTDNDRTTSSQSGSSTNKSSQKQLLLGAIKRKSSDCKSETEEKSRKISEEVTEQERPDAKLMAGIPRNTGTTLIVAGILPGMADYDDSDSSTENDSNSSDSEADHMIMPSIPTQRILQEMMQRLKEEGCG
uniref:FAM192A/Fyv6 N-terminal domain-containing protein n=1 Tax=Arion vulgaris TaxID=1028688 RepID=A0A0B6ZM05_9EUPU